MSSTPSSSTNWNYDAEQTVAAILGCVPDVGSLLSGLCNILWPTNNQDVWNEIESQVEQLMNEEISQVVYGAVTDQLQGLENSTSLYLEALNNGSTETIAQQWITTRNSFVVALPYFQSSGYQVLLLPLFGQFGNLYLSLLRDGIQFGANWGFTTSYIQSIQTEMNNCLDSSNSNSFVSYANTYYQQGYNQVVSNTPTNYNDNQPFYSINQYVRQMTLTLLDFVNMWPYFNPAQYPGAVTVYLTREIYSDPVGTCTNSGAINLPSAPTQPISQLTVWGWDRIDAVQLTYPANSGPGGVTTTARMGDSDGGSNQPPHGGVFNISSTNPITIAGGLSGSILNAFTFTYQDGSTTGELGGNYPGGSAFSFSYPNEIMSSIHINGISDYYGSADCAVFGFEYQNGQVVNSNVLRIMYVSNPHKITLKDFVKLFKKEQLGAANVEELYTLENWQQQRDEYWTNVKKRKRVTETV